MANPIDRLFGRVGRAFVSSGSHAEVRQGLNADMITAHGKGRHAEAASWNQIFIASTAVAGVAPGTAISTTPPMDVHNPANSGVLVSILKVTVGYVSGTLGAGSLIYTKNTQEAAPSGGSALTPSNGNLSRSVGLASAGQGRTIDATPTIIRPSGIVFGASLATTAALPIVAQDVVDGEIILQEKESFCVEGVMAAGSTPKVMISVTWQEIPNS